MIKNAPVLEVEDLESCGYDYRVDIKGDKTFGYLSHDDKGSWMFSTGSTPSEARIEPVDN